MRIGAEHLPGDIHQAAAFGVGEVEQEGAVVPDPLEERDDLLGLGQE